MEKTFNTFQELLDFDFSKLEPNKSNYLRFIPTDGILPTVRKEFQPQIWRIVEKHNASTPGIIMEITPRWLTITIHRASSLTRKADFPILGKNPKTLIREIFV